MIYLEKKETEKKDVLLFALRDLSFSCFVYRLSRNVEKMFFPVLGEFLLHALLIVFNLHSLLLFMDSFFFVDVLLMKRVEEKNTSVCYMRHVLYHRIKTKNNKRKNFYFIFYFTFKPTEIIQGKIFLEKTNVFILYYHSKKDLH